MTADSSDIILERMMSLHPKIIDLTLDRMVPLLEKLGNPERSLPPVIHIAGTNGKGSTQATIRAGLEAAGKKVHAYTSPHLARFHERIRLAGHLISEEMLTQVLDECVVANGNANITYFEITTIAAMLAFSRTPADYTLLEVGLGGEFDATNIFDAPDLTVITPISIDHQQYLGETLGEIAVAKAGILKRNTACIVGPQPDDALDVIESKAARLNAPLKVYGQHWHIGEEHGRMVYQDEVGLLDLPLPKLIGAHQIQNAGIAIAALRHLGFDETVCDAAVTQAEWPARLQRLRKGPLVDAAGNCELWLDGGHNAAAGKALAEALGRLPDRPLHLICGMLNTKDVSGFLRPFASQAASFHAVSIPGESATLSAQDTAQFAKDLGLSPKQSSSVKQAIKDIAAADPTARILICGSLYLAGAVLRENG